MPPMSLDEWAAKQAIWLAFCRGRGHAIRKTSEKGRTYYIFIGPYGEKFYSWKACSAFMAKKSQGQAFAPRDKHDPRGSAAGPSIASNNFPSCLAIVPRLISHGSVKLTPEDLPYRSIETAGSRRSHPPSSDSDKESEVIGKITEDLRSDPLTLSRALSEAVIGADPSSAASCEGAGRPDVALEDVKNDHHEGGGDFHCWRVSPSEATRLCDESSESSPSQYRHLHPEDDHDLGKQMSEVDEIMSVPIQYHQMIDDDNALQIVPVENSAPVHRRDNAEEPRFDERVQPVGQTKHMYEQDFGRWQLELCRGEEDTRDQIRLVAHRSVREASLRVVRLRSSSKPLASTSQSCDSSTLLEILQEVVRNMRVRKTKRQ